MANMFSGKTDKQIPKTLSDCTKRDYTVANLHSWAERLENWGKTLLVLLITTGIVSTIIEGISIADIDEDLVFITCLSSIMKWGFYAFVEYCLYHVLALLISALASITQNTIITANIALYEAAENEGYKPTDSIPSATQAAASAARANTPSSNKIVAENGDIICPKCGTRTQAGKKACWSCGKIF